MTYFYITLQITFGVLSPVIIAMLLAIALHAVSAWAQQKKWDARYYNPKDKRFK